MWKSLPASVTIETSLPPRQLHRGALPPLPSDKDFHMDLKKKYFFKISYRFVFFRHLLVVEIQAHVSSHLQTVDLCSQHSSNQKEVISKSLLTDTIPSLRNRLSLSKGVPGTHCLPLSPSILMLRSIVNVLYRKRLKVSLYGLQCLLFLAPGKYAQMFCF